MTSPYYSNRTVKWLGALSPGGKVAITFPVRIGRCTGDQQAIVNTAALVQTGGNPIEASATTALICPPPPQVSVVKQIVERQDGAERVMQEADLVPGKTVRFRFELTNQSQMPVIVPLRDHLPDGLVVADDGGIGQVLDRVFHLAPAETKRFDFQARITGELNPEQQVVNVGRYIVCPFAPEQGVRCEWPPEGAPAIQQTNPVTLTIRGFDLGDAPDSTNHLAAAMTAYAGVPADFATVVDAAGGVQGPAHLNPLPFHLGRNVSREANADIGPDADPTNNILPLINMANRDHFDDGVPVGRLFFTNCATSEIPVQIFISPAAAGMLEQGSGYLNVWVDGERNGNWVDVAQCPPVNDEPAGLAFEHIVIDHAIDAGALGPGLHTVIVPTTQRVLWPADKAGQPAWLRVTLSERPANKTLNAGGIMVGDGRGYDSAAFGLGETEDYLWRAQQDPAKGADLFIRKQGIAMPVQASNGQGQQPPTMGYGHINWVIEYANRGLETATAVTIVDDLALAGDISALEVQSYPEVAFTQEGSIVTFAVGELAPGAHGRIVLKTMPPQDANTTIFTNTATITATSDVNPDNNQAVAQAVFHLPPPVIIEPGAGTTCSNQVVINGRGLPNSEIDLYLDGDLLATIPVDATGRWSYTATVVDGDHELYAIARRSGLTSVPSRTVAFTVDSTLVWNPLSLRFTDEHGRSHRPVDENGRTDESGWSIRLHPGGVYTVSVQLCCTADSASVQMMIDEETTIDLYDTDGDGVYEGSFTAGDQVQTTAPFRIIAQCGSTSVEGSGVVLIDPEGVVYDVLTAAPLASANVACMQASTTVEGGVDAFFSLWPAADFGQVNPQTTAADGYFSFFTPVGTYRLEASHSAYQPYRSTDIQVVSELVRYDIPLTPQIAQAATHVVQVTEYGFEPAYLEIAPGDVVSWVNMAADEHTATSLKQASAAAVGEAAFDSGLLLSGDSYQFTFTAAGEYGYFDATNPVTIATIVVRERTNSFIYLPTVVR